MSLVIDESFTSGIPAGFFGALETSGGTPTLTYVAGQGVDLASTTTQNAVAPILAAGQLASFALELDCEFTASGTRYQWGLLTKRGSDGIGNYLGVLWHDEANRPNEVMSGYYAATAASVLTEVTSRSIGSLPNTSLSKPWPKALSERRRLRIDWSAALQTAQYTVDDNEVFQFPKGFFSFTSAAAYPCMYVYDGTLRVHRVRIWDSATLMIQGAVKNDPMVRRPADSMTSGPGIGPTSIYHPWGERGYFPTIAGGVIEGVVVHDNSPNPDVVQSAPVFLFDIATQQLVASTISDPVTGKYLFRGLDPKREYTVLARDTTRTYNAVVKDRIVPV